MPTTQTALFENEDGTQILSVFGLTEDLSLSDFRLVLQGSTENDTITGGAGGQILRGGAGQDTLTGGAGNDIFVLENDGVSDHDIIKDFEKGDLIGLEGLPAEQSLASYLVMLNLAIDLSQNRSGTEDNDAVIVHLGADQATGGGDDRILLILEDYAPSEGLDLSDFIIL